MPHMKARFIKLYMKLCIKTPILVITVFLLTFTLLYYLSAASTLDVFGNFKGKIIPGKDNTIHIQTVLDQNVSRNADLQDRVYWYFDKNNSVYKAQITGIAREDDLQVIDMETPSGELVAADSGRIGNGIEVTVEFKTGEQRLLDRFISKGAK